MKIVLSKSILKIKKRESNIRKTELDSICKIRLPVYSKFSILPKLAVY